MAIPTFVAAGTVAADTAAITPGLPAGHTIDDILFAIFETQGQAITLSGYTDVADSPQSTGGTASDTRLTILWKRDNGSETAQTSSDSGDHQLGRIFAIRGCIATGNPWDVTSGGFDAASSGAITIPGDTTTVADCLVVAACAVSGASGTITTAFSSWANADLANVTERVDNGTGQGNGGAIGVATGEKATAGAYGNTTASAATAGRRGMISIALKPPLVAASGHNSLLLTGVG